MNHVAHLLGTIFLCGLWLPFWILISLTSGEKRRTVSVEEYGQVHWQ